MASDLLKKEEEYRKINEQLQIKTKEIMLEADVMMKMQDNILKDTFKTNKNILTLSTNVDKSNGLTVNCDNSLNINDPNIPDCVNNMGVKGMNHYFRAKIKTMQMDYDKLQAEYKIKCDELKKAQKDNQNLIDDKEKWFQLSNVNKVTMNKLENQVTALTSRVQAKEGENNSLRKEVEQLKKELKKANLNLNTAEVRLNRAVEEAEKIKTTLKNTKLEEKDSREAFRKQISELNAVVKRIEKHKNELLCGFKKQLQLIDNLKKQKICLESYKIAEVNELEFLKLLDWKLED